MFQEDGRPQTGALLSQIHATEKSLQTEEEKKSAKEAFLPKIITQDIWNFDGSVTNNVAKDFNRAYRDIIVDEYGKSASNQMKLVGMGHSLGSHLRVIISTSKSLKKIGFDQKANILLLFNNYSAVESVPGVKGLEKGIQDTLLGNGNKSRNRRSRPDAYYDEYEIGLGDVVNAVSEGIQDQVSSLKTAITTDLDEKSL